MTTAKTSKPLTAAQIKHISERTQAIVKEAVAKFLDSLPPPKPLLTDQQRTKAIRSGEAVLRKGRDASDYMRIGEAFDYPQEAEAKAFNKARGAKAAAFEASLKAKRQAVIDQAVLGSASDALAALTAFEQAVSGKGAE